MAIHSGSADCKCRQSSPNAKILSPAPHLRSSALGFRPSFGLRASAFGFPLISLDLKYVDEAVERIGRAPDAVIPILQALQDHYGYLPEEALRRVCAATQITPAAISGVSTFYDMFRHEPSGKHIVHVCHGTACHVGRQAKASDAASPQELRQNWPRFRGDMDGTACPLGEQRAGFLGRKDRFEHPLWKTPAPASGLASPIVWGDRVFFSGGDALQARSGSAWTAGPASSVAATRRGCARGPRGRGPESTGLCRLYDGHRRTAGLCLFRQRRLGGILHGRKTRLGQGLLARSQILFGHAASLATWRDRLILQLDQGDPEEDGKSMLYALDGQTGKVVWLRPRKAGASWASPIVIDAAGRAQIITLAAPG